VEIAKKNGGKKRQTVATPFLTRLFTRLGIHRTVTINERVANAIKDNSSFEEESS
jgi:hypothetical protein